jgi:hypothetical protein
MVRFLQVFGQPTGQEIIAHLRDPAPWLLLWTVGYLVGPTFVLKYGRRKPYGPLAFLFDSLELVVLFLVLAATGAFGFNVLQLPLSAAYLALAAMPILASLNRCAGGLEPRYRRAVEVLTLSLVGALAAWKDWLLIMTIAQVLLWIVLWAYLRAVAKEWPDGELRSS